MRGIRDIRTWLGAGLAVVVMAVGPLAPGAEGTVERLGGFKYVTESFKLPPGEAKTFKAPCPRRHHVLGGGHYNNGGFGDVIGAHSYPYDSADGDHKPDDGWAAQLRGFTARYDVSMYAICAKLVPEYEKSTHAVSPFSTSSEYAVACSHGGLDVIAGGTRGPVSVREILGYPTGSPSGVHAWYGAVANHRAETEEFTVLNVCTGLDTARVIGSENGSPGTQELVTILCPPATPRVVGGAPRVFSGAYNTAIAASRPNANRDGWEVWIDNYNTSDQVLIQVYAVCSGTL